MRERLVASLSLLPVRSIEATRLLDTVLVCAVATILIVRTDLYLMHYPQLGGHGLHIAHLLWGGLLMLISLFILLGFISTLARYVAAVLGGIGLGLFVDELGKFITADNNYFFKPAAALIYIFFVGFFLAIRQLGRFRKFTEREYLVNVVELIKDAALRNMDLARQRQALALLNQADPSDPLVPELRRTLEDLRSRPTRPPAWVTRAAWRVRDRFNDLVCRPWFGAAVIAFFVVWTVASLLQIIGLVIFADTELPPGPVFELGEDITNNPLGAGEVNFIQWADLSASLLATAFVVVGLYRVSRGRRAGAFAMFERALLVSLFFVQVFAFVYSQFAAVFGFLFNLVLFMAVRAILTSELEQEALHRPGAAEAGLPQPAPAVGARRLDAV